MRAVGNCLFKNLLIIIICYTLKKKNICLTHGDSQTLIIYRKHTQASSPYNEHLS